MMQLTIERTLAAAPDRVWSAFTRSEALESWFWPTRFTTQVDIDLRVGGRYRIASEVMGMAVAGEYLSVERHESLSTWRWDGETATTRVMIAVTPAGDGAKVVVTHEGFATAQARDEHVQGWNDCLDRLQPYLG